MLFPPFWPIGSLMTIPPPIEHVSAVRAEPGFLFDAPCHWTGKRGFRLFGEKRGNAFEEIHEHNGKIGWFTSRFVSTYCTCFSTHASKKQRLRFFEVTTVWLLSYDSYVFLRLGRRAKENQWIFSQLYPYLFWPVFHSSLLSEGGDKGSGLTENQPFPVRAASLWS